MSPKQTTDTSSSNEKQDSRVCCSTPLLATSFAGTNQAYWIPCAKMRTKSRSIPFSPPPGALPCSASNLGSFHAKVSVKGYGSARRVSCSFYGRESKGFNKFGEF